jgi:3-oxoacyl-[acyl-carrier protein] reductase
MADRYLRWTTTGPGRLLARRLGLPQPVALHRWSERRPALEGGPLLHLTAGRTAHEKKVLATALDGCGLPVRSLDGPPERNAPCAAVLLDGTGVRTVTELREVHSALHPVVRSVAACGRVVVLGALPDPDDHHQAAAQQALEGFVRSLGKELGRGRTAQLARLGPDAEPSDAASTLRFLLSPRSAFDSGQVVEVGPGGAPAAGRPRRAPRW